MPEKELIRSELVCFLQQKSNILPMDDLVKITTDFYSWDEIKEAVASVVCFVDQRIPAHKGADKERKTVVDLLKLILNPEVKLPLYVAVDIARLPPVGIEHMDMSALLQELALLRSEVRAIGVVRAELEEVKCTLKVLQQSRQPPAVPQGDTRGIQSASVADGGDGSGRGAGDINRDTATFSSKAQDLRRTGMKERVVAKSVVGSSTTNNHVKSVDTVRTVDIFVSRLDPHTSANELVDCVNTVKGDLSVRDVKCDKLKSKFEHLYSSFHVAVTVSTVQFKSAIDLFSSAEAWPAGVFVKRYFKPRNGAREESS